MKKKLGGVPLGVPFVITSPANEHEKAPIVGLVRVRHAQNLCYGLVLHQRPLRCACCDVPIAVFVLVIPTFFSIPNRAFQVVAVAASPMSC